jgi:hypothetical protein
MLRSKCLCHHVLWLTTTGLKHNSDSSQILFYLLLPLFTLLRLLSTWLRVNPPFAEFRVKAGSNSASSSLAEANTLQMLFSYCYLMHEARSVLPSPWHIHVGNDFIALVPFLPSSQGKCGNWGVLCCFP